MTELMEAEASLIVPLQLYKTKRQLTNSHKQVLCLPQHKNEARSSGTPVFVWETEHQACY
jgi:hypothetical protein